MKHPGRSQFVEVTLPAFNAFVTYYKNNDISLCRDT